MELASLTDLRLARAISQNRWSTRKKTTPNELEVFTKARETRLLAEHEAGKGPCGDPVGTDVVLRRGEAATSAQIRLKRTSKIYETPIQGEVNARERTEPTFRPDDIP